MSAARASHSDKRAKRVTRKYAGRPIPLPDGRRSYNRSDKANTLHFERHELRERLAPHPTPTCKRGFCFAGTQDHTRTLGSTEQLCTVLQSRNARLGRPAQPQAKQPSDQVTKPTTAVTLNVHTAARACSRLCISAREDVSAPARQPEHRKPSPATPRDISWDLAYREVDTHPIGLVNGGGGGGGRGGHSPKNTSLYASLRCEETWNMECWNATLFSAGRWPRDRGSVEARPQRRRRPVAGGGDSQLRRRISSCALQLYSSVAVYTPEQASGQVGAVLWHIALRRRRCLWRIFRTGLGFGSAA